MAVIVNVAENTALMKALTGRTRNLSIVFRSRVGPSIARNLRKQFESRGGHLGTPWAPLTHTTIRMRTRTVGKSSARRSTSKAGRAKAGFATPMRDTDRLYRSLTALADPEGIREYGTMTMEWGTRLEYALPQAKGFRTQVFGRGRLREVPARPVIPDRFPVSITKTWDRAIGHFITTGRP